MIRCVHGQPAGCYQCALENRQDFTRLFQSSVTATAEPHRTARSRKSQHRIRELPPNDRRLSPSCQVVLVWLMVSLTLGWLAGARLGLLAVLYPTLMSTLFSDRPFSVYFLYLVGLDLAARWHPTPFPWADVLVALPAWLLHSWLRWRRGAPFRKEQKWLVQMRHSAYLPAELEWARACPRQTLDLILVLEESAAGDSLPSIRFDLEQLLVALPTCPVDLRVGLATGVALGVDRDALLAAIRNLGTDRDNEPTGRPWEDVLPADWRPGAQKVVCWMGSAAPAGQDGVAFGPACSEKGIVVHRIGCQPHPSSAAEGFARIASETGGLCLALTDAWLLLPLLVAPLEGSERRAVSAYVAEEWALQIQELQWQETVDRLSCEGYQRVWAHAGPTTWIEASHCWPGVRGLTQFEALRPDGTTFEFEAEVGEGRTVGAMSRDLMSQHRLVEHDQLLLRPRGLSG